MTVCQGSKLGGFLRGRESVLRASGGTKRSFIPVGQELCEKTTDTIWEGCRRSSVLGQGRGGGQTPVEEEYERNAQRITSDYQLDFLVTFLIVSKEKGQHSLCIYKAVIPQIIYFISYFVCIHNTSCKRIFILGTFASYTFWLKWAMEMVFM